MGFENLWDGLQVGHHIIESTLGDFDGRESQHFVAERPEIEVGSEAGDDAALEELVEPGLDGAAGHFQQAGQLENARSRVLGQGTDQLGVEAVYRAGRHERTGYRAHIRPVVELLG